MMRWLLALAALLAPASMAAQSLTLTNLKPAVAPLCPKAGEVTTIAAFWKELRECAPKPAPLTGVLSEGDSISVSWSGSHTGLYAATHPGEPFYARAVGGSMIETMAARFEDAVKLRPARVTVLIGANGIPADYLAKLSAYAARWKSTGAQVYLSTITPQCNDAFNAVRGTANAGIRALGYPVIDYAADPVLGSDAAGCDKALYPDGVHPSDAAQQRMGLIYAAKLDGKPAPGAPPSTDFLAPFDLAKGLQPAWGSGAIPGIYNPDEGAFRFTCGGDGKLAWDDPLVYPGKHGAAHLHLAWGSEDFTAFTTPESLRAEPRTNCNATPFSLNRSLYWMPALVTDSGEVIRPDLVSVYYKRKTKSSPFCTPGNPAFMGTCVNLPDKIRFIFGWDQNRPTAKVEGASWYCSTRGEHFGNLDDLFAAGCPVGAQIVADTLAPNCWNGRDLDSPDHRSHMAYTVWGEDGRSRCPSSHPFLIPQEENKATWTVTADMIGPDGRSRVRLSSDHMLPGAKPGQTLHADYMEAWVTAAKKLWHDHCIDKALNCSGGDLGNGQQLIGASQPVYGWVNPRPRVQQPPR